MSRPRRQLQRGQTLQKVRSLQELVAHQHAAKAHAFAQAHDQEVDRRRGELAQLDRDLLTEASGGISASHFMRYQSLREMHTHAVVSAQTVRDEARAEADARRDELRMASRRRRQAERLVEITQERVHLDGRRDEQKNVDDVNCARAGLSRVA